MTGADAGVPGAGVGRDLITPDGRLIARIYAAVLGGLLVGYMFMGRGFAHIGIGPIFIGDVVLLLGIVAGGIVLIRSRAWPPVTWTAALIVAFGVLGAARTLPYLSTYGLDALRDGVLWGYAAFALIVYVIADRRLVLDYLNSVPLGAVLKKWPKVNFVAHAQTFWANIDAKHPDQKVLYPKGKVTPGGLSDRYLADYPNFFGDMSAGSGLNALIRDEDHARGFIERHQDKLCYGSDCPDNLGTGPKCTGASMISAIRRLSPSKAVERKLLFHNASKIFRLT